MTFRAKLLLGAISAINRTVFKPPSTSIVSQTVHGRCFYSGFSVLHVVMSVCLFGAVQLLFVLILTLLCAQFISAMVTEWPLFGGKSC